MTHCKIACICSFRKHRRNSPLRHCALGNTLGEYRARLTLSSYLHSYRIVGLDKQIARFVPFGLLHPGTETESRFLKVYSI